MSLEAAKLIMEVEEHFGIDIPVNKYPPIKTLGDLCHLVVEEVKAQKPSCKLRYRAGRTLVMQYLKNDFDTLLGISPDEVRPDRLLKELIPLEKRRGQWQKLREKGSLKYPELLFSEWVGKVFIFIAYVLGILLAIATLLLIGRFFVDKKIAALPIIRNLGSIVIWGYTLACFYLFTVPSLGFRLLFFCRRAFFSDTVEQLVSELFWLNRKSFYQELNEPDQEKGITRALEPDEVRDGLYWIVANIVDLDAEQLRPENDLSPLLK
jgi:hypothetical protein